MKNVVRLGICLYLMVGFLSITGCGGPSDTVVAPPPVDPAAQAAQDAEYEKNQYDN